jgi:hypothetical protein
LASASCSSPKLLGPIAQPVPRWAQPTPSAGSTSRFLERCRISVSALPATRAAARASLRLGRSRRRHGPSVRRLQHQRRGSSHMDRISHDLRGSIASSYCGRSLMSCVAGLAIGMSTHLSSQPQSRCPHGANQCALRLSQLSGLTQQHRSCPPGLLPQILVIYRSGPCLNVWAGRNAVTAGRRELAGSGLRALARLSRVDPRLSRLATWVARQGLAWAWRWSAQRILGPPRM